MIQEGHYYKMTRKGYDHHYFIKRIDRNKSNEISSIRGIYFVLNGTIIYDQAITNNVFWEEGSYVEITKEQYIESGKAKSNFERFRDEFKVGNISLLIF